MQNSLKKTLVVLMGAMMLILSMSASCFAATANSEGADNADTLVKLTQAATPYDFEVTEAIVMNAEASSVDATVDNFTMKKSMVEDTINITEKPISCNGWIPVSERLPEKEGRYFVCVIDTDCPHEDAPYYQYGVEPYYQYTDGKLIWEVDLIKEKPFKVIAWMPIPEYKGE